MKYSIPFALCVFSLQAMAHSSLFDCFANNDGTATCEAGYSDGASAAGTGVRVELTNGKVLYHGVLDEASSYTFEIPDEEYSVVLEAGEGHQKVLFGDDIY